MCVDLGFPLTLDYVRSAPASLLLARVRTWLERSNPVCLMHPHGFFVVPLSRTETEDWRFHLWQKGPKTVVGMPAFIHTHDCHVSSKILQGELTNLLYDVRQVSTGGHPLYTVGYGGDRYSPQTSNFLIRTEIRVEPQVRSEERIEQGGTYHVERCAYHEAVIPEHLTTVTLVCMHGRSPGQVSVVGLDGYPQTIAFVRPEYEARDIVGNIMS